MSKIKLITPSLLACVCAGCVMVPQTKISWTSPKGSTASLKAPKDVDLKGLKLTFIQAPDGTEHPVIMIDEYKARTNPEVVDKASAGQVQIVNAWRGVMADMLNAAAAGYSGHPPQSSAVPPLPPVK
jgi:hypothetical protein